ncbi:MAG: hypothetical protein AAF492_12815 [Verrucomicrobiota bacterium]
MKNDEKDRHVLAAAVHSKISVIITFNLKDFKKQDLEPWGVEAQHPQDFVLNLYSINSKVVLGKLTTMAADTNSNLKELLVQLKKTLPTFAKRINDDLELEDLGP